MDATQNEPGTVVTCTDDACGCQLTIDKPCPHGSQYRCGCGHLLEARPSDEGGA